MKNRTVGTGAAIALLILILDSRTALAGGAAGVELCLKTVIPTLFPFIFLSNALTASFYGTRIPFVSGLFHLPDRLGFLLVPAFLGGYPVGAQCVTRLYDAGSLPRSSAERMLAFCSNVGPSFLFGILGNVFPGRLLWCSWMIQLLSAFTAAQLFRISPTDPPQKQSGSAGNLLEGAVKTLGKVCGWILLFRILIAFLDRWFLWLLPRDVRVFLIGLLELSNGCCALGAIGSETIRFVAANGILAFGGLCVLYQTAAVCDGLSIRYYLAGKCIQMVLAMLFAVLFQLGLWYFLPIWAVSAYFLSNYAEKKSSIPAPVVV